MSPSEGQRDTISSDRGLGGGEEQDGQAVVTLAYRAIEPSS